MIEYRIGIEKSCLISTNVLQIRNCRTPADTLCFQSLGSSIHLPARKCEITLQHQFPRNDIMAAALKLWSNRKSDTDNRCVTPYLDKEQSRPKKI